MRSKQGGKEGSRDWRFFQKKMRRSHGRGDAWKSVLKLFSLLLVASIACVSLLYAAKVNHPPSRAASPAPPESNPETAKSFHPPRNGVPHFDKTLEGRYVEDRQAYRFSYTVDPALQTRVNEVFKNYQPPFGAFVALDPRTGKILALTDFSRKNPNGQGVWQRATYPAASVFKLVTAAGALEKGVLDYDSPVFFRGNQYRLGPRKLTESSKRDRRVNFDEALGKSNNVVFGRVASNLVGPQTLRHYSEAFGFNHPIRFDFPVEASKAIIPEAAYDLARCGSGFGEVTLNPIHAAMIAASIANQGMMMRPYIIEEVSDREGERLYQAKIELLAQPISAKTAQDLTRMMLRTVEDGTASKTFNRYGKSLLQKMSICGKTGSLSGDNPPGLYDWFVGFAPADHPRIAFSAMVINNDRWRIKGAFVVQEALKEFFREKSG